MVNLDNYYDIVLIQPPLFKKEQRDSSIEIEKMYWKTMYEKGGSCDKYLCIYHIS